MLIPWLLSNCFSLCFLQLLLSLIQGSLSCIVWLGIAVFVLSVLSFDKVTNQLVLTIDG